MDDREPKPVKTRQSRCRATAFRLGEATLPLRKRCKPLFRAVSGCKSGSYFDGTRANM
jgi:hypothetical protein